MSAYQYLPKAQKQFVGQIDAADMDALLEHGACTTYVKVVEALADMLKEHGPQALNDDQMRALLHPYQKWGSSAGYQIWKLRKTPDRKDMVIKAHDKSGLLDHVDGSTLEMLVEAGEWTVAHNIYQAISIRGVNSWTDGQMEYVELYDEAIH